MIFGSHEFLCVSMPSLWIPLAGCLAWIILLLSPQHSLQHLPSLSSLAVCKSHLACPHRWVTHTLFCLFLIWADKCSLEKKSPNSAIRVHHVFVLSKIWSGTSRPLSNLLFTSYRSLTFPMVSGLDQTCSSAVRVPAPMPPLLTFSNSHSILYFRRRTRIIFLGSSLSTQTDFCFQCKHFFMCLRGMWCFLSAKADLTFCSGSYPWNTPSGPCFISFLSLGQLLPLCLLPMSKCFQLYLPTIQLLLPGQTSWNRPLCMFPMTTTLYHLGWLLSLCYNVFFFFFLFLQCFLEGCWWPVFRCYLS